MLWVSSSPKAICREVLNLNHLSVDELHSKVDNLSELAKLRDKERQTCVKLFQYSKFEMFTFLIPRDTSMSVNIAGYNLTCDIVYPFRDECKTCHLISKCDFLEFSTSGGLNQCTWQCTALTGSGFLYIQVIDNNKQARMCEIYME